MVASGWLVFGGAGGSGVCRVFLYLLYLSRFLLVFFFFFFFVHASFPFLAKEREGRRAEDASFVRKGSKSQTKEVRAAMVPASTVHTLLSWIHANRVARSRLTSVKVTVAT